MSKKMKIKGNQNTQVAGDMHSNRVEVHLHTPEAAKVFAKTLFKKTDFEKACLLDRYLKNGSSGTAGLELAFFKKIYAEMCSLVTKNQLSAAVWVEIIEEQELKKGHKCKVSQVKESLLYRPFQKIFKETLQLCSLATLKKLLKLTDLWDFMPTEMYALALEAFLKKPKFKPTEIDHGFMLD